MPCLTNISLCSAIHLAPLYLHALFCFVLFSDVSVEDALPCKCQICAELYSIGLAVCLVTWPLDGSKAEGGLVLIQTSLL